MARKLMEDNKRIGTEPREDNKKDGKYAGAFVKEPISGFYSGVSAFDFASLYPSIMMQFNISPDSYIEQVSKEEIAEKRKNKDVIVCENGVVYKNEDSVLKQIQSDLYNQRKEYKAKAFEYFEKARDIRKKIKKKF
jgi:DNA polymerase elongation subunit (family B)